MFILVLTFSFRRTSSTFYRESNFLPLVPISPPRYTRPCQALHQEDTISDLTLSHQDPPRRVDRWAGTGLCALSAAGFASLTIFGKFALQANLPIPTILGLRFLGAGLILALVLGLLFRRRLYLGGRLTAIFFLLGAVGYAGQSSLFFAGLSRNPAAITSLLLYAYPVFVAILERVLYKKRLSPPQLGALFLSLLGILTIFGDFNFFQGFTPSSFDVFGAFLVLGSAMWYAGYIVISGRYVHQAGPWTSTMWISFGAAFSFTLIGAATDLLALPTDGQTYLLIAGMIFLSTILALGTFLAGIERVGPTTASLLSTLEPVFTVLLAIILLNERLDLSQFVGGFLIFAAVLLLSLAGPNSESE